MADEVRLDGPMSHTPAAAPAPVPDLGTWRDEVRAFLESHAVRRPQRSGAFKWGAGSDRVALFSEPDRADEATVIAAAKAWRSTVFDAGFGWITGPPEYGGRGLPAGYQRAYQEVERLFETPPPDPYMISLGMVAPTVLTHAVEPIRQRYLPALYRGDLIGCQLFSEPGAGSDLAGISTRATRDGDHWVVEGQKVWTSGAHYSDIGLLLARTSPGPRHRNLTAFLVDMDTPGADVRPLRQMTGGAAFNEVFLSGVVIPDDHRLGDVDGGWTVALTTLMHERNSVGGAGGAGILSTARLVSTARQFGLDRDPVARQALASVYARLAVARYTRLRSEARRRSGMPPGPEGSIAKLAHTQNLTAVADLMTRFLGPRLIADSGEWGTWAWREFVLGVPGFRLGGGTDEIQRNILAERVLGLPKDPPAGNGR